MKIFFCSVIVNRFVADPNPDPNSIFMPIQVRIRITDPDWHQDDGDPHADPTPSFILVGNYRFFTFFTAKQVYNVFLFSSKACHDFKYF
jgi:hypothetical protein